jgi:chemotaxis receptor (MCP) glutamine deamidase CheD
MLPFQAKHTNQAHLINKDGSSSFMPNSHVAAGTFRVSKAKHEVLEAILGSCVAVAIVDRRAQIGGLYHIILPEPATPGVHFRPGVMRVKRFAIVSEGIARSRVHAG